MVENGPGLFPVVGIGTSAGGLEALELFLRHVPENCGMAFVVIQHLSPDHSGSLPGLLQRYTGMKVEQVPANTRVRPDCVYVIPPNKVMLIKNRTLCLHDITVKPGLRLSIDSFFCSLADDCAEAAIGVILSGMGSDGTIGMRAIRERSGLTLVQDPLTAKFDSMPRSVMEADLADIIAPAEELPGLILNSIKASGSALNWELDPAKEGHGSLQKITRLLKNRTKHDFSLYKPSSVYRRIERRMGVHKIDSIAAYAAYLEKNYQEQELLFKELLIGVTGFFRDPSMWNELKTSVLPEILAAYPEGGVLRAWSCGCSTGEEPYSLAMLFREALDQVKEPERFSMQIFATDLDTDAIDRARKGIYSSRAVLDLSPERLKRFFNPNDCGYQVSNQILEMVIFAQHNVLKDPPYTKLDMLVCRNLLIYLSTELQERLIPLFHYSLKPKGVLFLGSAESVGVGADLFTSRNIKSRIYWRSGNISPANAIAFPTAFSPYQTDSLTQEFPMPKSIESLQPLADKLILQHFSAPTVLVNGQGDIVYISGRTGKYLEPAAGKANMNIFAMAREGLLYEMGCAFRQAVQQTEPVRARAKVVEAGGGSQYVDMTLLRIETPGVLQGVVMISFRDVPPLPKRRRRTGLVPDSKQYEEMELELLKVRNELRLSLEENQATQEELKSINEELQSTNEELQSSNEELTTSKEEMQSMNEELQSVNAEQSVRLEEYMRINNDMENLLNSTEIVTIFLDNHLLVRRFTNGANRLFKLIPGDIGRPLTDIVSKLNYPQLSDHVQDVLRKLVSVEARVATLDGLWFQVRIMPYRTMYKKIDGVVITFIEITSAIQIEERLRDRIAALETEA